jgi:hypothetical protein
MEQIILNEFKLTFDENLQYLSNDHEYNIVEKEKLNEIAFLQLNYNEIIIQLKDLNDFKVVINEKNEKRKGFYIENRYFDIKQLKTIIKILKKLQNIKQSKIRIQFVESWPILICLVKSDLFYSFLAPIVEKEELFGD